MSAGTLNRVLWQGGFKAAGCAGGCGQSALVAPDGEGARRPVSRVLSAPLPMRDGHSSGTRLTARLTRPTRAIGREGPLRHRPESGLPPIAPIRSCSRWGLPCRRRYRRRGALLPHRFTLAGRRQTRAGGLFSVALSLGSPPPAVSRHRFPWSPDFPPMLARKPASATVQPSGRTVMGVPPDRVKPPGRNGWPLPAQLSGGATCSRKAGRCSRRAYQPSTAGSGGREISGMPNQRRA